MPEEFVELASDIWCSETRPSEHKKHTIRNPNNHSNKTGYRIHFQDMRMKDMHKKINDAGLEKFGDSWHWSHAFTTSTKPFWGEAGWA